LGGESPGLETIGPAGLGVIRANSRCRVIERVKQSDGWLITLVRDEPDLSLQPIWNRTEVYELPTVARTVQVLVVSTAEGPRVRLNLDRALAELTAARLLSQQGNSEAAFQALDALALWFPDPLLRWERDEFVAARTPDPFHGPLQ
jgi:hypothetical protein